MQVTKRIADELVNELGVEEVAQITPAGELRPNMWGDRRDIESFAARYNIPTV